MSQAKVKICGIKNEQPIALLAQLPVDYVGFVFANSTRKVSEEKAAALIQTLKKAAADFTVKCPETVGVFVNPTVEELDVIMAKCPLDIIQLHGNETPSFCEEVKQRYGVQLFKVFSVRTEADDRKLADTFAPYVDVIDSLMLDTHDPVYGGGSGVPFRWSIIPEAADWCESHGIPLIVAGGLHADNVASLLEEYAPNGVDVSSGVETDGEKDEDKIRQFVGRVKS